MRLRAFLTTVMSLLSIVLFFLASIQKNMFWLWISFVCAMISGVFVQLFLERKKRNR